MENFEFPAIGVFLARYKDYSEMLSNLIKEVLSEDLTMEGGRAVVSSLDIVREETVFLYQVFYTVQAIPVLNTPVLYRPELFYTWSPSTRSS